MGADHFPAAARIEVRHFGNIDHKSPYVRLKLVQHMLAKAEKRPVMNHSAGDLDEIDVVSHFRGKLHAPTVLPDSIRVKIRCVLKPAHARRGVWRNHSPGDSVERRSFRINLKQRRPHSSDEQLNFCRNAFTLRSRSSSDRPRRLCLLQTALDRPPTGVHYQISRSGGAWPIWSPNGSELVYRMNIGSSPK